MNTLAITLIINAATSFFKNYVFPRWGKPGVHVILFVIALVAAVYYQYLQHVLIVKTILKDALALFIAAIALYEVVLSYFPFFKSAPSTDTQG